MELGPPEALQHQAYGIWGSDDKEYFNIWTLKYSELQTAFVLLFNFVLGLTMFRYTVKTVKTLPNAFN